MKKKVDVDIVNLSQKKTEDLVEDPLDDKELRAVLGRQAKIVPYHDLSKYRTIDELMPNQKDAVVLLYENKPMDGHWVGLTKNNGEISFFDPYGEVVDKQLQYSRYSNQRVQGEGDTSLSRLLSTSKLPVFFNDFKYQRDGGGVNTCGRHVSNFIRYNLGEGLDLEDYNEMMMKTHKETGLPYDDLIAKMVPIHIPHPDDAQRQVARRSSSVGEAEGASKPNDLALYEKAKSIVYPRYSKPSAYRSGALQKEYKRLGGTYSDDGGKPLKRWFKEGWKDVGQKKGDYPLYRPTKRISKDTPATASEIGQKRLAEQDRLKQQYKGEKNLPSFKGGAKTAEEKKAYAREYYRRNREEIVAKARAKRYGYTYRPPEAVAIYESPFADEENLVEDVVAKRVLASLAKKKADEAEAERAEMARRQKEQVEREFAMMKAMRAEEEAEERRREEVRKRSAEYLQKNRDKINAAQRARAEAERALRPPKKPLTAKEQKQKEARERYAAKKKAEADPTQGADDYLANLRRNLGLGRSRQTLLLHEGGLRGGRRTVLTPVEQVGNYFIKRDDLYEYAGQRGGKVRSALYLIKKGNADCLTTAGNRNSPQINIVSSIGKKLGKPVVAFTSTGELGPEVELAKSKGAVIKQVRPGYETVITRRAKDYAEAKGCDYIPFGMDTPDVHFLTAEQVDNIPNDARRIVIPVGSASSIIGVIKGLMERGDKRKVLGVVVGANPTKKLDKYVPNWRSVASLVFPKLKYHEPATETKFQGIDLDPFYEAKTIPYLKLGDLLWVVGVREGQTGDGGEGHEGTDAVKLPAPQFKSELVEAKKSGVKGGGWGLYAKVDIPKGERIAPFYGEEMKWADFTKKYGPYKERSDLHQYAYISRRTGKIILSFKQPYLSKNVVNYINEIPPNFNVELKQKALFAIKDIQKGEELSLEYPVDYDRYWLKGGDGFAE